MVTALKYSNTNTYLIEGSRGSLLFDTGWAGTFGAFCKELGEKKKRVQDIDLLMISHFHPDHMGIAQQIANEGAVIAVCEVQREFIHSADRVFAKEKSSHFCPIDDTRVRYFDIQESRSLLAELGIDGEVLHTPGHSDDSISLWLEKERTLLVGDLNPLYELEMHKGTLIEKSWDKLLKLRPDTVCYGHAKAASLKKGLFKKTVSRQSDIYALVKSITRLIDKGCSADVIMDKTGAKAEFIEDVARMYLTHPGVSVQGILDRIEIKGR